MAIKVQRPGLLQSIALDIFILRNLAKFVKAWKKTKQQPARRLIDDWGEQHLPRDELCQRGGERAGVQGALRALPRGVRSVLVFQ